VLAAAALAAAGALAATLAAGLPAPTGRPLAAPRRAARLEVRSSGAAASSAPALAAAASLRTLLDQQRLATPLAQAATPAAAGLRASATATLDAVAAPAAADLASARAGADAALAAAIHANQFPADCSKVRLLVGALDKACGFACQMHHAVHLLAAALATNRTLVLYADEWRYAKSVEDNEATLASWLLDHPPEDEGVVEAVARAPTAGRAAAPPRTPPSPFLPPSTHTAGLWEALFRPVTHCATPGVEWALALPPLRPGQLHDDAPAVVAGIIDGAPLDADPPSVPADVHVLVSSFHSRPDIWYVGALAAWLTRAAPAHAELRAGWAKSVGLAPPYIGVHIRRTDKLVSVKLADGTVPAEAVEVPVSSYLTAAQSAWTALGANASPPWPEHPIIYLATDDPDVVGEARSLAPRARILVHPASALAATYATRDTPESAAGIADDVHFLSGSSFLVGSHSSQVTRLAHELAQVGPAAASSSSGDASLRIHSVDSLWYFGGGGRNRFCASAAFESGRTRVARSDPLYCFADAAPAAGAVPCRAVVQGKDVMAPAWLLARCADHWRGARVLRGRGGA
jgi:hypothetical protein